MLHLFNGDQTGPFDVLMTAADGRAFNLLSFDATERFSFVVPPDTQIVLTGTRADASTVTATLVLDQIRDAFQTFSMSGMTNVVSVLFSAPTRFPIYDNIVVSEVPLPAALPLFLAGLGGLGAARYRRRKAAA